ncbi:DUF2591 domain-containing protein [Burkholderia glumae]|uniref:DUF2591 domain-containing protein n=1 Tax=Burkholderia glumae TaxID=337 RepID=A0ABY5BE08_BURGL|nr:DUF2591 domain-containing protein [Burkholderia glumae]ACR28689.1 Hypothetical protein bglu_1g15480 [Burkholderia glumae BGR1]PJO24892.1 DUF2591 domain-containing protein [Burkholderia glumae AU6208]QHE11852.1 DUF2591 domain-containing protein [Burkholderia glumae AU6208]USS44634.1 DUF2591 domain-containing protein [Burkholderia glumae]
MKVSELSGALLDLWVARAEGDVLATAKPEFGRYWLKQGRYGSVKECPRYSTDWAHGGPIIGRERIELLTAAGDPESCVAQTVYGDLVISYFGSTRLTAAMRVFVASRFGAEVPDEVPA